MDSDSNAKEVSVEFQGLIRVYKDGSVERLLGSPYVSPSLDDPETGVASKDVTISPSTGISARIYLPKLTDPQQKLPILVYFHGGGFFIESAFSTITHRYMNILASSVRALVVSVEYRLAPEHPLPAAYEDSWTALNWVASQLESESWIADHGDLNALFIGGDSAGANIVHNVLTKAGSESLNNGVKICGAFLAHSFFLDEWSEALDIAYKLWDFVYPNAPGGSKSVMINPVGGGAQSLAGLGCEKLLVVTATKDLMRDSGVRYYEALKASGFGGSVELFEVQGEDHRFHIFNPDAENAKLMFKRLASFISQ